MNCINVRWLHYSVWLSGLDPLRPSKKIIELPAKITGIVRRSGRGEDALFPEIEGQGWFLRQMANTEAGLMTTDINVAILWRVVHKVNKRVNKVRLKSFVPYNHFTPSLIYCNRGSYSTDHALRKIFSSATTLFQFYSVFLSVEAKFCYEKNKFRN